MNKITDAIRQDLRFAFEQTNPKQQVSAARYDVYKAATSFADLEVFKNQTFDVKSGMRVLKGSPESKGGDFVNDVMKGFVTFRYPAPSAPAAASAVPVGGQVGGQVSGATSGAASSSASPGLRRSPRRLRLVLVAHARSDVLEGDLDPVDAADRPLSEAERSVYSEVMRWNGPESSLSRRTSSGVCTELPAVLVMAARDDTLTDTPDESLDVPKSMAAMSRHKEWTTGYLPALKDRRASGNGHLGRGGSDARHGANSNPHGRHESRQVEVADCGPRKSHDGGDSFHYFGYVNGWGDHGEDGVLFLCRATLDGVLLRLH